MSILCEVAQVILTLPLASETDVGEENRLNQCVRGIGHTSVSFPAIHRSCGKQHWHPFRTRSTPSVRPFLFIFLARAPCLLRLNGENLKTRRPFQS